jgi:hypothetical protein
MFIAEIGCQLVLVGFSVFSHGILEHGYYWAVLMIMVNVAFTPLALLAAVYDHGRGGQTHDGRPGPAANGEGISRLSCSSWFAGVSSQSLSLSR